MTATVAQRPALTLVPPPAEATPLISQQVFALAAAYRTSGLGPGNAAAMARLLDAAPGLETSLLAAWDTLDRLEAAGTA